MAEVGTPRRGMETDPVRALALDLAALKKAVAQLGRSANLRNASISGGEGVTVKDADGNVRLLISTDQAAIIAYDAGGTEVARYGLLSHTDAGEYGLEVLAGSTWVHVGDESVTWANVAGKPAWSADSTTIPASALSGSVASALEAVHAGQADGSQWGFENTVSGSSFYALWVGNDGGYHFGRNVSSIRYKENVRPMTRRGDLAALRPVVYDRKPTYRQPFTPDGFPAEGPAQLVPGAKGEFGLIAEEVEPIWPEVVTRFDNGDGKGPVIDGIRYDLVGPRLIPYVQGLEDAVASLTKRADAQDKLIQELLDKVNALGG